MNKIYEQLLVWYSKNKRDLPWRNTRDPYKIWLSEIMLQQTRVAQVIDYFMTFLRYFPTISDLAKADEKDLLKVWQGLGYYSRALNIQNSAKSIMENHNGIFPNEYQKIRELKGIGDYTAAAIGSIAFGLHYAAVDGNVKRVASRFYGIKDPVDSQKTVASITELLNSEITAFPAGDFNQAMIELGALICLPTNPSCDQCPLQYGCVAFSKKIQHELPVKTAKKAPRIRYVDYVFLTWKNNTWIERRDHSTIWKGLYEFPNKELDAPQLKMPAIFNFAELLEMPENTMVMDCYEVKHQLTHQTIFARFWHLSGKPSNIVRKNTQWICVPTKKLHQYPVHRLMHKYLENIGLE